MTAARQEIATRSVEEWMGLRRGRVTSSVAAAALGIDPWMTPLQAWAQITGRESFDGNKATVRGTRLEDAVLDYPTRGGHLRRKPAKFVARGEWAGDSADCLYVGDGGLLVGEGKTVAQGGADGWGEEGTDEVPDRVVVQCLWHLAHWPDASACLVPVLFGGYSFEFREYFVRRDDDLIGELLEDIERWHRDYVIADVAPAAEAGDDEALKWRHPRHTPGQWADPTPEIEALVREYLSERDAANAHEAAKKAAGARLKQLIGDCEGSSSDAWRVTWKHQGGRAVTNWEAIARELGATDEDIQRHTGVGDGYRVLRANLVKPRAKKGSAA